MVISTLYHGTSYVLRGAVSGLSQAAPHVSRAASYLAATVGVVGLTALSCACCVFCIKSGALKATLKVAGKSARIAGKTGRVAGKGAKFGVKAGKAGVKIGKAGVKVGTHIAGATAKPAWTARDLILNLGSITYIGWQAATLPQQVLIGTVAGIFVRFLERKINWEQWQDTHKNNNDIKNNYLAFSYFNSHNIVQHLPCFGGHNLLGIYSKVLAVGAAYAASRCVKEGWLAHPVTPYAAGGVLGYQMGSFILNLPWDAIATAYRIKA